MRKSDFRWWVILCIVLIAFNVLAFAIPFAKTTAFFVCYAFGMIAILLQICVINLAFRRGEGVLSKFYGFPIAKIGVIYLIAQLVLGFIFMAAGKIVPAWIPLIIFILMLGAAAIGLVAADAARDEVVRQDAKIETRTSVIRDLQTKCNALVSINHVAEVSAALKDLADDLRYSDPVSNDALADIETQLSECVDSLKAAVEKQNPAEISALCKRAQQILRQRNELCKMTKKASQQTELNT